MGLLPHWRHPHSPSSFITTLVQHLCSTDVLTMWVPVSYKHARYCPCLHKLHRLHLWDWPFFQLFPCHNMATHSWFHPSQPFDDLWDHVCIWMWGHAISKSPQNSHSSYLPRQSHHNNWLCCFCCSVKPLLFLHRKWNCCRDCILWCIWLTFIILFTLPVLLRLLHVLFSLSI